jgi:hypothetical protein
MWHIQIFFQAKQLDTCIKENNDPITPHFYTMCTLPVTLGTFYVFANVPKKFSDGK